MVSTVLASAIALLMKTSSAGCQALQFVPGTGAGITCAPDMAPKSTNTKAFVVGNHLRGNIACFESCYLRRVVFLPIQIH